MRVLFATKVIEDRNFQPLGIFHLSASLKAAGHETSLVDARSETEVLDAIERERPQVLAISTPTARYRYFQRFCAVVKRKHPDIITALGGIHVSLVPESVRDEGIDAVCVGEGDRVFVDLADRVEAGRPIDDLRGFWVRSGDTVTENDAAPLIRDLDALPPADRAITDRLPYCRSIPIGVFVTSRGCPFKCTFCSNGTLKNFYRGQGSFFRAYSPGRIMEEIREAVAERKYRRVIFMNEVFAIDLDWLAEFAGLYRENPGRPFWCMLHPTMIREEMVRHLKNAGCEMVELGIESGNERVRREILGRPMSDEQILEGIRLLHKYGIKVQTSNILGLPGTSLGEDLETVALNRKAKVDFPDVCLFQPLPKTPLADKAMELGLFDGNFDAVASTINPSSRRTIPDALPHAKELERMAFLFPLASKSDALLRVLPTLARLPIRFVYLIVYKMTITWFKIRYIVGAGGLVNTQFLRILWSYVRY